MLSSVVRMRTILILTLDPYFLPLTLSNPMYSLLTTYDNISDTPVWVLQLRHTLAQMALAAALTILLFSPVALLLI